jgi:hypothetical protein
MASNSVDTDAAPAVNDAYTGMLAISLIALVIGCVLLFLDYNQYDSKPPNLPKAPAVVKMETPAPSTPAEKE